MKTLDDELSFIVRNSLDTYASVGVFVALVVGLSWKLIKASVKYVMGRPGKHRIGLLKLLFCENEKKTL